MIQIMPATICTRMAAVVVATGRAMVVDHHPIIIIIHIIHHRVAAPGEELAKRSPMSLYYRRLKNGWEMPAPRETGVISPICDHGLL